MKRKHPTSVTNKTKKKKRQLWTNQVIDIIRNEAVKQSAADGDVSGPRWIIDSTARFWSSRCLLLISRLVAAVVLLLATSGSDGAKQHPAGLEEGNQKRLFGLRPVPADQSSRFYAQASSLKVNKSVWKPKWNWMFYQFIAAFKCNPEEAPVLWWIYDRVLTVSSTDPQESSINVSGLSLS